MSDDLFDIDISMEIDKGRFSVTLSVPVDDVADMAEYAFTEDMQASMMDALQDCLEQ